MRYGHFDPAAGEYVITRPDVPVSWTNYLGSGDYCVVLGHNGGGYSYHGSPQRGRSSRSAGAPVLASATPPRTR